MQDDAKKRVAIAAIVSVLVVLFVFRDALSFLIQRWTNQEELGHSFFIPVITGWLIWSNRDAVVKSIGAPSSVGIILGVMSAGLLMLGPVTHTFILQDIGLVLAIIALVVGFGGPSLLKITAIPLVYLFFAIPPPAWVITTLSWNMQNLSSEIGVAMIRAMNIPVNLSGNIIDLGLLQLQVAEACSGLRYLFPLLSLGFLAGYLFKAPLWQRIIVFLSALPITILMNSLRIAITGALVESYGLSHTEGFLHFFEGWVIFVLCLAALVGIVAIFCLIVPPRRHVVDALAPPELDPIPPSKPDRFNLSSVSILGGVSVILFGGWLMSLIFTTDKLVIPERTPFVQLPFEFKGWDHIVRPLDSEIAEVLAADDSIVADFKTPEGEKFNIYLAYLTARRDGSSWHSPQMCIPGGGWNIIENKIIPASEDPDGLPHPYYRMVVERARSRQIIYYWYDQRGRKIANEYKMKAMVVYDTVTRRRADGSLVRVMTPVKASESIESADNRLIGMAKQLNTYLPKYVPH